MLGSKTIETDFEFTWEVLKDFFGPKADPTQLGRHPRN